MRRLSEVKYPESFALCPFCVETFINDLPPSNRVLCPNDGASMMVYPNMASLEHYKRTFKPTTVSTTPSIADPTNLKENKNAANTPA